MSFISGNIFVLFPNFLYLLFEETHLYIPSLFINQRIGQITILGYYTGILSRLILSLNRLVAIHAPIRYKEIFSNKNTYILLFINWIIGFLMLIPLSFGDMCYFINDERIWSYGTTKFCSLVSYLQDFLHGVIIACGIIIIDIITAIMLIRKTIKKTTKIIDCKTKKLQKYNQRKKDINIFLRTVISNIFLILSLISFHYFSLLTNDNINWLFVTTSMFWMFHHFIDGTIVGLMNSDVKKHLLSKIKKQSKIVNTIETTKFNTTKKIQQNTNIKL
uniref:G-protein coupled receptors family 1 profile domain-containing protein n=1 Tax=Strongyloides stercoralis TaxID=6248 RepID=A0AAF5D2S7_STRER